MAAPKKKTDRHLQKQINLRIPHDLAAGISAFASKHHTTTRAVIEVALRQFLANHKDKPAFDETAD